MKALFWSIAMLFVTWSCKESSLAPELSSIVSGSYTAQDFRGFTVPETYPINGQTITVQIKGVSQDTVIVNIQATPNDIYSPGKSITYNKAYVIANRGGKGVISSYTIFLDGIVKGDLENTIMIYTNKTGDYTYTPPGYTKGIVVTRLRMI